MAITATTSILTGDDWKLAKDLRPGDWIFNRFGQPVQVKLAQMYRSEDCYRVTFHDYLTIEGDKHLTFHLEDTNRRERAVKYKGKLKFSAKLLPKVVSELAEEDVRDKRNRYKYSLPSTHPIQLPHQPHDIPAFIYGFWYSARLYTKEMRVPDEFAEKVLQIFRDNGYKVTETGKYYKSYTRFRTEPSIWDQLRGNMPTKMPLKYLNGSEEQRLELIRGILCADRCKTTTKRGYFMYKSQKKHITTAFQYLSETLGATTTPAYDKTTKSHDVKVRRLPSFLDEMDPNRPFTHYSRRYVKSIEPIPAQLCVHIETDDSDGSYLAAEGFIACH